MGQLFKIILYAVLLFYIFDLIIRAIFKRKMRKLEKKTQQESQRDQTASDESQAKPHLGPNIGEYTDFEEVE